MTKIIRLNVQEKNYKSKERSVKVLKNFHLDVERGEKVAVVGKSGSGKTTLLNILGLLDRNYVGSYELFGENTKNLNLTEMAKLRNGRIGFVLQESALIHSLTIEENIKLPLLYAKSSDKRKDTDFNHIVKAIGIESILQKKPLECSGGEKSRAVFARAMIMNPEIILCDESTASLDEENKNAIINLLFQMNQRFMTTIVTVTHDISVAQQHDRIIQITKELPV